MTKYIINRLFYILVVLLLVSMIIFFVTNMLPGSAAHLILGEYATPEAIAKLEEKLGLDKPFYMQYLSWIKGTVTGQWGQSRIMKQPVSDLISLRLKNSAFLALFSLLGVIVIGIPLGVWAAVR